MNTELILKNLNGFIHSPLILKKTFLHKVFSRIRSKDAVWGSKYEPLMIWIDQELLINDYYRSNYSRNICTKYMDHQFNFLGTGWIKWNRENKPDEDGYVGIDWCKDFITGYRFIDKKYSSTILKSAHKGADIKRVWEMGRMNHLPFMSLVSLNNPDMSMAICLEIKRQILDIIDHSPVGSGAQYYCPMDVGIRCVNILISMDILKKVKKTGLETDTIFLRTLDRYILNQLSYILDNLEYNFADRFGGNHLLCDISSALFICMHYAGDSVDRCYKRLELLFYQCVEKQFLQNGTNFECSSCYHRFTSEMLLLGLLSIQIKGGASSDKFKTAIRKLYKAKELLEFLTGSDGNITQIGDNDSGFVLKICPDYKGDLENTLSTDFVIGAINSFCGGKCVDKNEKAEIGFNLVQAYLSKHQWSCLEKTECELIIGLEADNQMDINEIESLISEVTYKENNKYSTKGLGHCVCAKINDEFGVIRFQYENGEVFIRSAVDYEKMFLGHAHDDIFHFEIVTLSGRRYADCGSICYTGDPKMRFLYASAPKHNTVIHNKPLLDRKDMFVAESKYCGFTKIEDRVVYIVAKLDSYTHIRKFIIDDEYIKVLDASDDFFMCSQMGNEYSYGYGNVINQA